MEQIYQSFHVIPCMIKWISGRSLPSIDNFLILSKVLHTSIEDILVVDGDIFALKLNLWKITIVHKF